MEQKDFKALEEKMQKSLNILIEDMSKIHANRVSETQLKPISVVKEHAKFSLIELGLIRSINNNTLAVKPWDTQDIPLIEKAISSASLGANIGTKEGEIHVIFPALTQERRKDLSKSITTYATNTKHSLRSIRHDFIKANKSSCKEEEIKIEKEVQKIIDKFNVKIDEITDKKQQELMKV